MRDTAYKITMIAIAIVATISVLALLFGCIQQQPPPPPQVIVQHDLAPPPKPVIPPDPWLFLRPDVYDAIKRQTNETLHDGITTIWPYSVDQQWVIDCQPLNPTSILLRSDESTDKDNVMLGDVTRWQVRVGTGAVMVEPLGTNTTIISAGPQPMVVPPDPHMVTTLAIHTTKRNYRFTLRLHGKSYMPAVEFYYPDDVIAEAAARKAALAEAGK